MIFAALRGKYLDFWGPAGHKLNFRALRGKILDVLQPCGANTIKMLPIRRWGWVHHHSTTQGPRATYANLDSPCQKWPNTLGLGGGASGPGTTIPFRSGDVVVVVRRHPQKPLDPPPPLVRLLRVEKRARFFRETCGETCTFFPRNV